MTTEHMSQQAWLGNSKPPHALPFGLTIGTLVAHQKHMSMLAAMRLQTVGADQYDNGGHQAFETMSLAKIADELRAELLDVQNYAVFLDIKVQRLLAAVALLDGGKQ